MSAPIIIPDNCQGLSLEINERQWDDLKAIANKPIGELCGDGDDSSLLVFPNVLGVRGDIDSEDSIIRIREEKVYSGNLMGFIGRGDTMLKIRSRFDKDSNDFFMHYLLEKVFSINLFNLPYQTSSESIFDFSLFLFPYFLKKAMSQGIYREYVTYNRNDENLRGVIDISRHIQKNIPFTGKIAYRVREHTSDNPLLELIRHTIEYIREKDFGTSILSSDEDMKDSVAAVISATPTYSKSARLNIIIKNLRSRVHPYFSEYEPLRQLCLQILRQEGIKYGEEKEKVYGVIFDGAWLWEAYLNTVLVKEGFRHPENRLGTNGVSMFADPEADPYLNAISALLGSELVESTTQPGVYLGAGTNVNDGLNFKTTNYGKLVATGYSVGKNLINSSLGFSFVENESGYDTTENVYVAKFTNADGWVVYLYFVCNNTGVFSGKVQYIVVAPAD